MKCCVILYNLFYNIYIYIYRHTHTLHTHTHILRLNICAVSLWHYFYVFGHEPEIDFGNESSLLHLRGGTIHHGFLVYFYCIVIVIGIQLRK
jgi:hypothetical protein